MLFMRFRALMLFAADYAIRAAYLYSPYAAAADDAATLYDDGAQQNIHHRQNTRADAMPTMAPPRDAAAAIDS